jgi:hypothetical protein
MSSESDGLAPFGASIREPARRTVLDQLHTNETHHDGLASRMAANIRRIFSPH